MNNLIVKAEPNEVYSLYLDQTHIASGSSISMYALRKILKDWKNKSIQEALDNVSYFCDGLAIIQHMYFNQQNVLKIIKNKIEDELSRVNNVL